MANSYFHRVRKLTATKMWINNVTRDEAQMAINALLVAALRIHPIPGRC